VSAGQSFKARIQSLAMGDENGRWNTEPEQWGRAQTFGDPWAPNVPRALLSIDGPVIWRVPSQQTLLLKAQIVSATTMAAVLRWQLDVGVGAARATYLLDALALQQICVPAAALSVSLRCEALPFAAFNMTGVVVEAAALVADGTADSSAARFTQFFDLGAGTSQSLVIPTGATSWRLAGVPGSGTDPFVNTVAYAIEQPGPGTTDRFTGDQLLPTHVTGDFIPAPGTPTIMHVFATTAARGAIVWSLEL
jgi:hypothetical protein